MLSIRPDKGSTVTDARTDETYFKLKLKKYIIIIITQDFVSGLFIS